MIKLILLILVSMPLILGCQSSTTTSPTTTTNTTTASPVAPVVGNKLYDLAPDFQLQDLEGNTVSLSDFRGNPVLINFWRINWPFCIEEFPYLQEIYQNYSPSLVFLTINTEDSLADAVAFIEDNDYSFPVLLDTDYAVSLEYGIFGVPITYFIDKDGIIQVKKIGGFLNTAEIEGYLGTIMP